MQERNRIESLKSQLQPSARVELIAQRVADEVKTEHGPGNSSSREPETYNASNCLRGSRLRHATTRGIEQTHEEVDQ